MKQSEIYLPKVQANPENMLFRFSLGQALYEEDATADSVPHLQKCADSRTDWMVPRILLGSSKSLSPKHTQILEQDAPDLRTILEPKAPATLNIKRTDN